MGNNSHYLTHLRANTVYPAFRRFIRVMTILTYIVGVLAIINGMALMAKGYREEQGFFLILTGITLIVFAKASAEAASMLADIADTIIESTNRSDGRKESSKPNTSGPVAVRPIQ